MTVGKAGPRRPIATGCGAGSPKGKVGDKKSGRTAVATGCGGGSTGKLTWKPKSTSGKSTATTGLSDRTRQQLDKAKTGGRHPVATGCGTSTPSKPAKPAHPAKPTRTGC